MRPFFEYLEYRDLLKDLFEERKASNPQYSYRRMGEALGLDAGNLFRILERKAHLPARCQSRALEHLGLAGRSAEYFVLLVAYARERNGKARQEILESALALRDVVRRHVAENELAYFREWWMAALRSLLEVTGGRAVPRELGAMLNPPIPAKEVADGLELGLVGKASSGRLVLTDAHLTAGTGPEKVEAVRCYQRQILSLAAESLERFPPASRDMSTLTLTVDEEAFAEVGEILRECRRQIQKRVEAVREPRRVMQLAMAFFPVSGPGGDR